MDLGNSRMGYGPSVWNTTRLFSPLLHYGTCWFNQLDRKTNTQKESRQGKKPIEYISSLDG